MSLQPHNLRDITIDYLVAVLPMDCIANLSESCNERMVSLLDQSEDIIDAYRDGELQCGYCKNKRVCSSVCECGRCKRCDTCASFFIENGSYCDECKVNLCSDCRLEYAYCQLCHWSFCENCWGMICCTRCGSSYEDCQDLLRIDERKIGICTLCSAVMAEETNEIL